eukprot:tig00000178_g12824.t1
MGTPFSLDLWVKIPRQAPFGSWDQIIDIGNPSGTGHNIIVTFCPPGGAGYYDNCHSKSGVTGMALMINLYTSSIYYETIAFRDDYSIPKDNCWHHLALVFTASEIRTYRNGSQVPHLKTGQAGAGFRIHSAALTAAQVMESFMGRQPAVPVELHYKLDSCGSTLEGALSGKDVPDSSGRGRSGKLVGDIVMACPPPAAGLGLRFGTAGGAAAQRYLDMSDFFASRTLVYPLSFERERPAGWTGALIVEYMFSDCPINRNVLTTTGELPAAKLVGDADVTAPCSDAKPKPGPISFPAPLVLSAISTGPMMVLLTANFTAGVGIDTLNAACGAPGAPTGGYVGSASVTDADAAGADVSVSLELRGESYVVSCSVKARGRTGVSLPSTAINATVLPFKPELPSTSLVFGTKVLPSSSIEQTERFLITPSIELGAPLTIAFWLRINMSQANPNTLSRLFDFGSGVGSDNIILSFCGPPGAVPSDVDCEPHRRAGYETLLLTVYDGTQLKQRVPLFLAEHSIPADGSWHHVALVLVVDAYYAFLDGVPRPSARASSFTPGTGTVPKRTRTTHYVGAGWPAGSGPYAYGVELADFRVYSAALSAAQVADVAQGNVPWDRPPLELHYKFDTCGGTAVDYSGKGRPGTMYGDLGPSVPCPVPAAGAYFGTSEIGGSPSSKHRYIEAPKFALGTPFSLDLWVRIPRQAPISNWQSIIDFGCGAGCHNIAIGWCVPGGFTGISQCHSKAGATGLAIVIHLYPEPTNPPYYETVFFRDDYSIPKDNQWHHLTFVFTNAEFRTYRNGSLLPHMKTGQAGPLEPRLQTWKAQSPSDVYYSGFRIHSAALTAEQVMEAFMGRQPAAPVVLHYKLDSCGSTLEGTLPGKDVPDSSGRGLSGKFVGDIAMACPPPAAGLGLRFGTAGGPRPRGIST